MLNFKTYSILLILIHLKCFTVNAETQELSFLDSPLFDGRVDKLPENCYKQILPKECGSATECTNRSGIYKIQIDQYSPNPFYVLCDDVTENGDWLIIQRRQDGSEDFYRGWSEYESGFGSIDREFFIGLKKLYALTNYNGPQELLIIMEGANETKAYAKYDSFAIGNTSEKYYLKSLGRFSGTAGNSLNLRHIGMKFTTKDNDNDSAMYENCAVTYTGAWWYSYCHDSNLNGKYGDNSAGKGVNWKAFRGYYESLVYVKMMIRRSRNVYITSYKQRAFQEFIVPNSISIASKIAFVSLFFRKS